MNIINIKILEVQVKRIGLCIKIAFKSFLEHKFAASFTLVVKLYHVKETN